jgi:cation transport protein ChaC
MRRPDGPGAPALRLTRELVARLPERVDERGPIRWPDPPDSYFTETVRDILGRLVDGNLWVFAIGSLIWKPRFPVVERRPALVRGWHRAFCIGPDTRYRGNPAAPGLMLSLDRGGQCHGVAMRMDPADPEATLEALLRAEPPLQPRWVRAVTAEGVVPAIAFTSARGHFSYAGRIGEAEVADRLACAAGHVGSIADYLLNTITHLEAAGIHDRRHWRMQALVAERLERMPLRPDLEPTEAPLGDG